MKNIAIIIARSGSKGVPNKNIKILNGKPLMAWTIEAALDSGMFDTVMVSTDSEEYAKIAREYGAEVPFLRSEETSRDNSNSWDAVAEVIAKYKELGREFDTLMLLQPTSPLRDADDIKDAYRVHSQRMGNALFSVCECDHNPLLTRMDNGTMSYGKPEETLLASIVEKSLGKMSAYKRRQDMPRFFRTNGAIFMVRVDAFEKVRKSYDESCYMYLMPQDKSIDIDTELDFIMAEAIMSYYGKKK